MKKVFFLFAASLLFVACGQKESQATEEVAVEVIFEEATDSVGVELFEEAIEEVAE